MIPNGQEFARTFCATLMRRSGRTVSGHAQAVVALTITALQIRSAEQGLCVDCRYDVECPCRTRSSAEPRPGPMNFVPAGCKESSLPYSAQAGRALT